MNNPDDPVSTQSSNPAAALFEREWLTYRKMVNNEYVPPRGLWRAEPGPG